MISVVASKQFMDGTDDILHLSFLSTGAVIVSTYRSDGGQATIVALLPDQVSQLLGFLALNVASLAGENANA